MLEREGRKYGSRRGIRRCGVGECRVFSDGFYFPWSLNKREVGEETLRLSEIRRGEIQERERRRMGEFRENIRGGGSVKD